jgi:hypothetical protein
VKETLAAARAEVPGNPLPPFSGTAVQGLSREAYTSHVRAANACASNEAEKLASVVQYLVILDLHNEAVHGCGDTAAVAQAALRDAAVCARKLEKGDNAALFFNDTKAALAWRVEYGIDGRLVRAREEVAQIFAGIDGAYKVGTLLHSNRLVHDLEQYVASCNATALAQRAAGDCAVVVFVSQFQAHDDFGYLCARLALNLPTYAQCRPAQIDALRPGAGFHFGWAHLADRLIQLGCDVFGVVASTARDEISTHWRQWIVALLGGRYAHDQAYKDGFCVSAFTFTGDALMLQIRKDADEQVTTNWTPRPVVVVSADNDDDKEFARALNTTDFQDLGHLVHARCPGGQFEALSAEHRHLVKDRYVAGLGIDPRVPGLRRVKCNSQQVCRQRRIAETA